jgi:hypothetical protein
MKRSPWVLASLAAALTCNAAIAQSSDKAAETAADKAPSPEPAPSDSAVTAEPTPPDDSDKAEKAKAAETDEPAPTVPPKTEPATAAEPEPTPGAEPRPPAEPAPTVPPKPEAAEAAPAGAAAGAAAGAGAAATSGSRVTGTHITGADKSGHVKSIQDLKTEKADDAHAINQKEMKAPKLNVRDEPTDWGHQLQIGVRAAFLGSFVIDFRYQDTSPYCVTTKGATPEQDTKTCGFLGPSAIDGAISFGVTDTLEPYIWGRFGLADTDQINTTATKLVGVGLRVYTMPESRLKIFFEPAVGVDFSSQGSEQNFIEFEAANKPHKMNYETDLVLRLGFGPQFEIWRMVGLYAEAGATIGVLRSFQMNLDFGGGIQIRTP